MGAEMVIREGFEGIDWDRVTGWLTASYWSPGIAREQVRQAAEHSALVLGAFAADGRQIAYCRVVSDRWRFAYLCDVIVDPEERGGGVGRALVRHALDHPSLASVMLWSLLTKDAHGVYAKLGFAPLGTQPAMVERWMVLRRGQTAPPATPPYEPELTWRAAVEADLGLLAEWNHQLIRDEGHRNSMSPEELAQRMRGWLAGEYRAVLFELAGEPVAYAVYREALDEIYLRQLFVAQERRREGVGRRAVALLRETIWPRDRRLTVEVLTSNAAGVAFWRAMGYRDYGLCLEILPG